MAEIRRWEQFVHTYPVDLAKGQVRVENEHDLTNLAEVVAGRYRVHAEGKLIAEGALPDLDVAPHASKTLTVPVPAFSPEPGVEYWLVLVFALKADTPWATAGHVLDHDQHALPFEKAASPLALTGLPELSVTGGPTAVEVKGTDFTYGFDPATGLLTSLQHLGTERLAGPLRPDFWRAPNDNDRGSDMMKRLGVWRDAQLFR